MEYKEAAPLSLIEDVVASYNELLNQRVLETVDVAAIAKLLVVAQSRVPQSIQEAILRHLRAFASNYVSGNLPPHPRASTYVLSHYITTYQYYYALKLWEVSIVTEFIFMVNQASVAAAQVLERCVDDAHNILLHCCCLRNNLTCAIPVD